MRSLLPRAGRSSGAASEKTFAGIVAQNIGGRVGYLIVGFGASIALARLLGPADRGLLGLMISTFSLGLVFTTFGLPLAAVYFSSRKETDQGGLLGNSLLQACLLAAVLIPVVAILHRPIAQTFGEGRGGLTWALAAAMIPVTFLDWTTHAQLQGMLMFGRYAALLVLSRVAYAAGIFAFIGVAGFGVAGGLLATALGSVVMVLGSLAPILARGRARLDWPLWGRSLHYGVRVQIGSIFQFTNGRLDVIILQFFRPLPQVGYYVVAQTIAELLLNLAGAFQTSVLPLVSHYEGDARAEATSIESMRHYGILSAVATVGNAGLGPLIIYFGFGPDFHRGIPPMLILLPGVWFLGVATVIQGDLSGRARPGLSSMLAGLAAGITVILDLVLIPPLGVYGGALASDSAYFAYGVASMIALSRVTGIPIRRFMIPRREDLRLYGAALRRLLAARRAQPEGAAERPPPPTDG